MSEYATVIIVVVVIVMGCWLLVCKMFSSNLLARADDLDQMYAPRQGRKAEEEGEGSKKKTLGIVVAWALLAVELVVALVIFLRGEGRVSKQETITDPEFPLFPDQEVCVEGAGRQLVSYAEFYRGGVCVVSQLILWALGEGLELPERAFFKMLVACASVASGETSWSYHFSHVNNWATALMVVLTVHLMWPLIVDVNALCVLDPGFQKSLVFIILSVVVCCCNSTCTMAPGEGGLLHVVDAIFNGVLGTWANVVQSGFALGAVFAVLPTFEIAYSVLELFVACGSLQVHPW